VELIRDRLCDALVSDYHIPALPLAVWALVDQGILPLASAWRLVSEGPAQVLGLVDRGVLDSGLRADLVAVHRDSRAIEMVIAGGRMAHLSGEAAARLCAVTAAARMAAE
jgi:alpha-D-ribose 1-methylphosphonate 5-triphosphate diphosphatase